MEFRRIGVLRGPNVWTRFPALEIDVVLHGPEATPTNAIDGFGDRLAALLASIDQQRPGRGPGSSFFQQVRQGCSLANVLQHLALLLQSRAGSDVAFGLVKPLEPPAVYRVVIEYEEEALGMACLEAAQAMCAAAVQGQPFDAAAKLHALCELAYDIRLGPSTGAIVRAAQVRNIPTRRLNEGSLVQLGYGVHQRRILTAETDRTGAIAEAIAQDKQLTRSLLQAVGVPVPAGRPVKDADDAARAAEEVGYPVVVKPQYGNHGRGVTTNLTTPEQVRTAYTAAREEDSSVIVETFIPGSDHRLLVVGDRLVAAARREPAHVIGDGRATIRQLIDEVNKDPRRSDGHATVLSFIKIDPVALAVLQEQGFTPESVPPQGAKVLIRRNGNLSTGGTAIDVTDDVHPELAARAVDAARVVGLDIAGVDVVVTDVRRPLEEQRGAVVEVNAGPGLRMHLQPSEGKPRAVGDAIVELLYPDGATGRIPVVAVTGVNGKTTTTRLIAHLLRSVGKFVGMTCTDGIYIDGRRIEKKDCSGPRSARAVLLNPRVEAAVLETARYGILREGLGFDRCDVAVVTNVGGGDHLGQMGIHTPEELALVKRTVLQAVAPTGYAVLNAADPLVAPMAEHCAGQVVYFTRAPETAAVGSHRAQGGRAVFVRHGGVVFAEGAAEHAGLPLTRIPCTHQGAVTFQVENVLAAAAAAWCLGLPFESIRAGLATFTGDGGQTPGRFNVFRGKGATVIVDFAHNATALEAQVAALDAFPHQRRLAVFSGINRRDDDVRRMGEVLGRTFDRVYLFEDRDNADRQDGELNALVRQGLAAGGRAGEVIPVETETDAVRTAFAALATGDLLVLNVEAIDDVLALVQAEFGADGRVPVTAE